MKVAIVNSELLHRDGETIMEMLQDSGIKSITYAQHGHDIMGVDIVVRNETSHTTLLSGIAQALNIFTQ